MGTVKISVFTNTSDKGFETLNYIPQAFFFNEKTEKWIEKKGFNFNELESLKRIIEKIQNDRLIIKIK